MTQIDRAIGIDCGKAWLDGAVFPGGERVRVSNAPEGHAVLAAWIAERGVSRVGIEASGGYERPVRVALETAHVAVHVLDPARVRHFAKARGQRAKTDPLDAAVIAEFTARCVDAPATPRDPVREEMAGLIRLRRTLVDKRSDLRKAVKAAPIEEQALHALFAALDEAIQDVEQRFARCLADSAPLAATAKRLMTAPGVGAVTATTLVALLPELGRCSAAGIAALAGVAPYADDSGRRSGQRHIAGGRALVRRVLYMATLVAATTCKGTIAAFYNRLCAAGKHHKVALVACMRKLIVRLNTMLTHDQDWSEHPI